MPASASPPSPSLNNDGNGACAPLSEQAHGVKSARVTRPVECLTVNGELLSLPIGPCLLEVGGPSHVEVIWGDKGEHSALLAPQALQLACQEGNLVLLDVDN